LRSLGGRSRRILAIIGAVALLSLGFAVLHAQSAGTPNTGSQASGQSAPQQDQNIPDAPSTVQPAKPLPTPPPSTQASPDNAPTEQPQAPQAPTQELPGQEPPTSENASPASQGTNQKPPVNVRTVPQGGATKEQESCQQEDYFHLIVRTKQFMVPVTVTDEDGRLVSGLTSNDFGILENGKKQKLNYFTSSAFAVSAAVVIDLGMKDVDLQKVNHTFPALEGALSQFDELSVFTYSNTVGQQTGWGAVGPALSAKLDELENVRGQDNGPPVTSGPIAAGGPVINGVPVDRGNPRPMTATQPARVMNDAILKAALELSRRNPERRKIIFVISDGREYRSDASYRDVLRVLLSNNIIVYAVGVGMPGVPGYGKLSKLHLPRFGYTDILPKYGNATGGQVWNELTRNGIEDAYSAALGYARDQYTLGYATHVAPSSEYRSVEVLVSRPSCRSSIRPCVNVYARDGYYAAPPR